MSDLGRIIGVLLGLAFAIFVSVPVVWMMVRAVWNFWT